MHPEQAPVTTLTREERQAIEAAASALLDRWKTDRADVAAVEREWAEE